MNDLMTVSVSLSAKYSALEYITYKNTKFKNPFGECYLGPSDFGKNENSTLFKSTKKGTMNNSRTQETYRLQF
jgi:hypothetical protein